MNEGNIIVGQKLRGIIRWEMMERRTISGSLNNARQSRDGERRAFPSQAPSSRTQKQTTAKKKKTRYRSNITPSLPPPISSRSAAPVRCCPRSLPRHRRVRTLAPYGRSPVPVPISRDQNVRWRSIGGSRCCRRRHCLGRYNKVSPDRAAHRSICNAAASQRLSRQRRRRCRRHRR